jgi:hypothetical protein
MFRHLRIQPIRGVSPSAGEQICDAVLRWAGCFARFSRAGVDEHDHPNLNRLRRPS